MEQEPLKTKVTFLGKGWGIRLLTLAGKIHSQDFVTEKGKIGPAVKELLRWADKMGFPSPMASASRDRAGRKRNA